MSLSREDPPPLQARRTLWQRLLSRLPIRRKISSHPSEDTVAEEPQNRKPQAAPVEMSSPSARARRGAGAPGTPVSRAAGISGKGESASEVPVEPQVSRARFSIGRLTVAALAFTVGGAAGIGLRWISEPSPPAVKEFEQAKRKLESMAGQVKSLKSALAQAHRTQSDTEKALADAEKSLIEFKARQAADAAERAKVAAARGYGVSGKAVKSMPCDLTSNKEGMAQGLKNCVKAFEDLNR
jgi:hypothetical protein